MKITELKQKATTMGLTLGKLKKADIIHAIQRAEGNLPCYGTAKDPCQQTNCCFYRDCAQAGQE